MLAFSRSGQLPPGECALRTAAQDVIDELLAEPQGVELRIALPDERVACAPEVLAQILRNLVGNALKYRAEGRRCRVELVGSVEGPQVRVAVEDNGIGMDPQAVCRAFEPFFRASADRAGHGLGLAIVDRYVRALGGSVLLTSQPGVGTRVEVRLPRASSVPAAVLDLRVTAHALDVPREGPPEPPLPPVEEEPTARA